MLKDSQPYQSPSFMLCLQKETVGSSKAGKAYTRLQVIVEDATDIMSANAWGRDVAAATRMLTEGADYEIYNVKVQNKAAFGPQLLITASTTPAEASQQLDLSMSPCAKRRRTDVGVTEFKAMEKSLQHNDEIQVSGILRCLQLSVSKGCVKDGCRDSSINTVSANLNCTCMRFAQHTRHLDLS